MSRTQEYQKKIADKLAFLESKLKRYGDLHLYDENIAMEDVVCHLLNLIYGYKLVNLNIQKENYPGIDLGDTTNRIAVQVTSDNSRDKVKETIRKFQENEYASQYDRLIIFVLGPRKTFTKGFETGDFPFSAEEDILDFHSLTKVLKGLEMERLKQINRYLDQEFPRWRPIPWQPIAVWLIILIVVCSLVALRHAEINPAGSTVETSPSGIIVETGPAGGGMEDMPTFTYETNMDWLRMDEAAAVLGTESQVYVYKPKNANEYLQCAALTVLYSNYSERDRCITEFTVRAEDIREDLSPVLRHEALENDGVLTFFCENYGWGKTGDFTIEYAGIKPYEESAEHDCVEVQVNPDAVSSWNYPSIEPGEGAYLSLFNTADIQINYKEPFEGSVWFEIMFRLYAEETGYETMLPCWLFVFADHVTFSYGVGGEGDDRNYVVWVPTSNPQWQETYAVQQWLPGNETVRLPVFIVPEKSCMMTIRMEFKTVDGEIIQATPLENARFVVPYYDETPEDYVDGNLLDWDQIQGNEVFCFPFIQTEKIVAQPRRENEDGSDGVEYVTETATQSEDEAVPISTAQELVDRISADPSGRYFLTGDIDLSLYNNGIWECLNSFSGVLDGRNHAIQNLSCVSYGDAGLFKRVDDAVFKNLRIDALVIQGEKNVGVVAGSGSASFTNCQVTCLQIGSDGTIGGLIGLAGGSVVLEDVSVDVSIQARPQARYSYGSARVNCDVGGIVGSGTVDASRIIVNCDITIIGEGDPAPGRIWAGGLIGDSMEATQITVADAEIDCRIYVKTVEEITWKTMSDGDRLYEDVDVDVGGLIGVDTHYYGSGNFEYDNMVNITNCDLTVDIDLDVFGTATAGGFIGTESGMNSSGMVVTIDNCSLTGTIEAQCIDGTASVAGSCFGFHPEGGPEWNTVAINSTEIQCKVTALGGYATTWGGTLSGRGNAGIVTPSSSIDVDLSVIPGFGALYIEGEKQ
ncbi:MAG: SMEK domain-containing protein [Clostridia bacterium]|nr:SMEK domain-containing protein [Clostridia bacterium]